MKKKIFAAIGAVSILLSLCACAAEQSEEPVNQTTGVQETTGIKELPEDFRWLTYEEYKALSPEEQQAYYEAFPSPEEYMVWFNSVTKDQGQSADKGEQTEDGLGQITQPTEPVEQPSQDPVTPTQKPEKEDTTTPEETTPAKKDPVLLTYKEYLQLSPVMQQAYCESFSSMDAFMQWFNDAAKAYNENKDNNSNQVEGNEGQITQPTEQEQETTTPEMETVVSDVLEGVGEVVSTRPSRQ